jgi:HK97 family phage portal protein
VVAVLDADTTFQPLTIPPEAMQFLESRRWSTTEIARMFGIPPHLVGDVEKSTSWGSGIEQQNIGFVAYTVAGYTGRISQRVSREVVITRGQTAAFDTAHLLRGTMMKRFAAYATGISSGWLTRNEARARENLEPIEGLSEPVLNANMTLNVNPANPPVMG